MLHGGLRKRQLQIDLKIFTPINAMRYFLQRKFRNTPPIAMDNAQNPNEPQVDSPQAKKSNATEPQQLILFRSKLTDQAGADYQAMNDELAALVRENPGFVDVKSYAAEDGERLTVVW